MDSWRGAQASRSEAVKLASNIIRILVLGAVPALIISLPPTSAWLRVFDLFRSFHLTIACIILTLLIEPGQFACLELVIAG